MHHHVKTTRDKKDGPYDHRTLAFRNGERALHHIDKKAQGNMPMISSHLFSLNVLNYCRVSSYAWWMLSREMSRLLHP